MKDFEIEDPYGSLYLEIKNKEKEKEEEIEEEIKEIEKASKKENKHFDSEVWDGSEALFIEDDDAAEYEDNYSGIKFSFSLKDRELFSCLKHCGWNINKFIFGSLIFLILDVSSLILFIFNTTPLMFLCFIITILISILWVSNVLPIFYNRLAYHKTLIGQKLDVEIYHDSIIAKENNNEQTIHLNGSCKYEDFNNMFLIFLPDNKVFIIPKRAIEPDVLLDVEAMLIAGTSPIDKD